MIRGRKNFLPPHPLIMGLTFLFKLVRPYIFVALPVSLPAYLDLQRRKGH